MPGSHIVKPKLLRTPQHRMEFDMPVTGNAGVWRAAAEIFRGEIIHHLFAEHLGKIKYQMGDPQLMGHPARIADVIEGAAASRAAFLHLRIRAQAQRHTRNVIPLAHEKEGGYGTVHAAAHPQHDLFLCHRHCVLPCLSL